MPTFRFPKPIYPRLDPTAGLVAAVYLRTAAQKKEMMPTLSSMLDAVASDIIDALHKTYPKIKVEHYLEQGEALATELMSGQDRIWEEQSEEERIILPASSEPMKFAELPIDSELLDIVAGYADVLGVSEWAALNALLSVWLINSRQSWISRALDLTMHLDYKTLAQAKAVAERLENEIAQAHLAHSVNPGGQNDVGFIDVQPYTHKSGNPWTLTVNELRDGKWKVRIPGLED